MGFFLVREEVYFSLGGLKSDLSLGDLLFSTLTTHNIRIVLDRKHSIRRWFPTSTSSLKNAGFWSCAYSLFWRPCGRFPELEGWPLDYTQTGLSRHFTTSNAPNPSRRMFHLWLEYKSQTILEWKPGQHIDLTIQKQYSIHNRTRTIKHEQQGMSIRLANCGWCQTLEDSRW